MELESLSLSRLSPRAQTAVFVMVSGLVAGSFYWFSLQPLQAEVALQQEELERLEAEIEEGRLIEARLPEFEAELRHQKSRLDHLKDILPDQKETAEIVRQIQELALNSNLRLKSFTPQRTVANGFYEDWPILISLEGTYNNLGKFFERVGAFTRLINIDDLTIKGLEDPAQDRTLGATCTATTFVFREEERDDEEKHSSRRLASSF